MLAYPCRAPESIGRRFAHRAAAERYRDRFKAGRRRRTHLREEAALRTLLSGLPPLASIADVGGGTGRFLPVFAEYAGSVFEIDFSRHMLEVGKEDHSHSRSRVGFVQADARFLPLATASVDMAFCHRLLNHLPDSRDRRLLLGECRRVTRRYVVVSCLTPAAPIRMLRRWFDTLRGRASLDGHVDPATLLADAAAQGLVLRNCTKIRSFPIAAMFYTLEVVNRPWIAAEEDRP